MLPKTARSFDAADLRRFFTSIDEHLTIDAALVVIGGSAIALYGVPIGTTDVDTFATNLAPLQGAIAHAREKTGLDIPVVEVGVADVPYSYEDRLQRETGQWAHLTVWKLEHHDLALSKVVRGYENDLVAIKRLHEQLTLDCDTLFARWTDEMGHVIGRRERLDGNFVAMIERLYGEVVADRIEARLRAHRRGEGTGS